MSIKIVSMKFPEDTEKLASFLTSEVWPFHVNAKPSLEAIRSWISAGEYQSANCVSFWISEGDAAVGFIRVFDLEDVDDGYPMFDLRLKTSARGKGLGKIATAWLVKFLFDKYPQLDRIAGSTRADNKAMRNVFQSTGFAKEGHFRKDWPGADGVIYDTVKYAILREDWRSGKITPVNWNDFSSPT